MPLPPAQDASRRPVTLGVVSLALVALQNGLLAWLLLGPTTTTQTGWVLGPQRPDFGGLSLVDWGGSVAPYALAPAGVVIGIVATVANRGRGFAIPAIVVGTVVAALCAPSVYVDLLIKVSR